MDLPKPGLPAVEYFRGVANGELETGELGALTQAEFRNVMDKFAQSDVVRCGDCFTIERLECPGMSWVGNTVKENTWINLACPYDLDESGNTKSTTQVIGVNITAHKEK